MCLCPHACPGVKTDKPPSGIDSAPDSDAVDAPDTWDSVDFVATDPDVHTPALLAREQWMGRASDDGKFPFAPWGGADPDDADPEDSPRWEWGRTENYVDGVTVVLAEDDPRLDGRVFL